MTNNIRREPLKTEVFRDVQAQNVTHGFRYTPLGKLPIINDMIQMVFFLRFRAQLSRTQTELVPRLEHSVIRAVVKAGGKITRERPLIRASFNEDSLGFWLDMLILFETLTQVIDADAAGLYGYALLLGADLPETPETLCRFLTGRGLAGGVFLDKAAKEGLLPYSAVASPGEWLAGQSSKYGAEYLFRLQELKIFVPTAKSAFPLLDNIARAIGQKTSRRAMIIGRAFEGRRDILYRYCAKLAGNFPPLYIRFGSGPLNAFTDAWPARLRSLTDTKAEELDEIGDFLFRERLRTELSPFMMRQAQVFVQLLLRFYIDTARRNNAMPVIVLENIHLAEKHAAELFIAAFNTVQDERDLVMLGVSSGEISSAHLRKWKTVFPRLIKHKAENDCPPHQPELPLELWEIAYALSLLGRYFPPDIFPRLFEEEGKSLAMVSRALSLLSTMGAIDTLLDARPWMKHFSSQAESVLGEKKERVQALTRNRLLNWVEQRNINPCFRMLLILAKMGGKESIDDRLVLKSIVADLVNGTVADIERACDSGALENLVGQERAAAVCYIFTTMKAFLSGNAKTIRAAFAPPPPDCAAFPVLKGQILVNLSVRHVGLRDNDSAMETVKEAILLSQSKNHPCLAQSYRLFSLVSLSRQRIGETIDYLGFAMDSAEKTGNFHELGVSAYYAAAVQFLYGNVSRALILARNGRKQALASGCPEWADRSRFLEGRLAFETGCYQKALELFENLRKNPSGEQFPEKDGLLAAWAYRSNVHFQNPLTPKPANGGHDADLFEVEAAYLGGDYRRAVELASVLVNPHIEENFFYTEQPDWRSGFAQCEMLYSSRGEVWERMLCVYHSLALCRLSATGGEEAMHNMQRIIRNEHPSEMDPWDAFYFYAWYRILEQTGASQVDMNTAVSMAFKRLQRRASRIEDSETRRQFLFQPRWNNALGLAAKEFKLI